MFTTHPTKEICRVCLAPLPRYKSNKRKNPLCHRCSAKVNMLILRRHIDFETAILKAQRDLRQQPSTQRWKERADRKLLETDLKKDLECLTLRTTRILDPNKRLRAHQALIVITNILSLHPSVPPSLI